MKPKLSIEDETEEVFDEVFPQTLATQGRSTSLRRENTDINHTSSGSMHSASYVEFEEHMKCRVSNSLPLMGFKRKWWKDKKDLKLRYRNDPKFSDI